MSLLDFIEEGSVPEWIRFLYMGLYLVVFMIFIKALNQSCYIDKEYGKIRAFLFVVFYTVFAVFYCVNSDYFSYRFWVENYESISSYFAKEVIYMIIARIVAGNYELFRLVVWGGAILITCGTIRLQKVNMYITLLFWFIMYSNFFCYARASLGIAVFTFGVSMISKHIQANRFLILLGFGLCILSISFHRSLIIGLITLPAMFFRFNKFRLVFFALFLTGLSSILIESFIDIQGFATNDSYSDTIQGYTEAIDEGKFQANSFSNIIKMIWKYSLFYHPFILATKYIFKSECSQSVSDETLAMYKVSAGIILVASALGVIYGLGNVFFYRILFMTAMLLSVVIGRLYQDGILTYINVKHLSYNALAYYIVYFVINISTH